MCRPGNLPGMSAAGAWTTPAGRAYLPSMGRFIDEARREARITSVLGLLLASASLALATDEAVFRIVERIQFAVPGDWPVVASKSTPEKTVFAFQIPNPADAGTPDSTNLSITSSYLKDAKDNDAFLKKISNPDRPAEEKQIVEGWRCRSFSAMQKSTQYVDFDCYRIVADCGVFVRIAWPHLPRNPGDYDEQMRTVLSDFLTSVAPSKKLSN
jgi:hypothetical protein